MRLFGGKEPPKDPKAVAKDAQKSLGKEVRDLDREVRRIELEEKKALDQVKQAAKRGDDKTARMLANNVMQLRKTRDRLLQTKGAASGMKHKVQAMSATQTLAKAMHTQATVMAQMNKQMDPAAIARQAALLERESAKAELVDEALESCMEGLDGDDMEDQVDAEVAKVLEELAVDVGGQLPAVAARTLPAAQAAQPPHASEEAEVDRLMAELSVR